MKKWLLLLLIPIIWFCIRTEVNVGRVIDNNGNGKVYNGESYYNYISYSGLDVKENDIVMTLCILNPLNNECDDIIWRGDVVLLRDTPSEER